MKIIDGRMTFAEWVEKALVEGRESEVLPIIGTLASSTWEKNRPIIEAWVTMTLRAGGQDERIAKFMLGIPKQRRRVFRDIWKTVMLDRPAAERYMPKKPGGQ